MDPLTGIIDYTTLTALMKPAIAAAVTAGLAICGVVYAGRYGLKMLKVFSK